jgi:hypothetical protein
VGVPGHLQVFDSHSVFDLEVVGVRARVKLVRNGDLRKEIQAELGLMENPTPEEAVEVALRRAQRFLDLAEATAEDGERLREDVETVLLARLTPQVLRDCPGTGAGVALMGTLLAEAREEIEHWKGTFGRSALEDALGQVVRLKEERAAARARAKDAETRVRRARDRVERYKQDVERLREAMVRLGREGASVQEQRGRFRFLLEDVADGAVPVEREGMASGYLVDGDAMERVLTALGRAIPGARRRRNGGAGGAEQRTRR